MANRRMFSTRVTESTRFIKMPASSQNLYFHLGMNADDDGVVEAYPIMCMIGATEDDLRILVGKQFITVLNEDYVSFLNDWLENNNIRADRKIDSIYRDLLLKIVPDACLKEAKSTYYSRTKNICQTKDRQTTGSCQPNDGIGKVRLGKVRLGKDSINTICPEPDKPTPNPSGIEIPLNDKSKYDVPLEDIALWEETYPAVDVKGELKRMIAWLDSNPTKRKTRRGVKKFINGWLARTQDKGGSSTQKGEKQPVGNNTYNTDERCAEIERLFAEAGGSGVRWEDLHSE